MNKPKKQNEKMNLGVPQGAPKYFYFKRLVKKKWQYFDKAGNEVTEAKVKKSKRKVYTYSAIQNKVVTSVKKEPKEKKKPEQGKKVIGTRIAGFEVNRKILFNAEENRKIFFRFKKQTYRITKESVPDFLLFFSDIHSDFFDIFEDLLPSPVMMIDYLEFDKNSIFDFDGLDVESGNAELEGMDSEDLNEEFEGIKKAAATFRATVTRKIKNYFF